MIYPYPSRILQRHRVEDERGLQFDWRRSPQLLTAMQAVIEGDPQSHVPDPAQALQDAYADALHRSQAVQVDEQDLTQPGTSDWDGTPVWLEFDQPRTFGTPTAFEGALVFRLPLGKASLLLPILLSKSAEWPLPAVVSTTLRDVLDQTTPGDPLHAVLTALSNLPPLPEVPPQHESGATLTERLSRHLQRVKTLAPQTLAAIPRHYLRERASWDARVFVPTSLVAAELLREGHAEWNAVMTAPEVAVLGAWRYAKHVIRIDEDVLASLRRAKPPTRLPGALPGLTSHAIYVPVPGGLALRQQTGFFAALDDLDGQVRLLLLVESRSYGTTFLAPISLPLGADIEAELRALAEQPGANYSAEAVREVHWNLALALLCIAYIGSPGTSLAGPGTPAPAHPRKGRGGKLELTEASGPRIWEAGLDVGERLRAYRVRAASPQGGGDGQSTGSGRTMPPHLRAPHPHGYWTGPGRNLYEIRFLDFIPVNMDQEDLPEAPVRLSDL
ncbi:hypothetical protein [Deinococcus aluminii]|uniref:Uncharacterized protein n=1 Tax=Deinococcus aluminii TaxID=1656885 RepID=A0ABP9XEN2_9DEIO